MIDSVSAYFNHTHSHQKSANSHAKQSMIGTRSRLPTASSTFIEKKIKNYTPKTKLFMPITLNADYMTIQETANIKNGTNLDELVTSFFSFDMKKKVACFTSEEWEKIIKENQVNDLMEENTLKRLYSSLCYGLPATTRRNIWLYLGEVEKTKQEYYNRNISYESLKNQKCSQEEKIKNDVKRSFGSHEFFKYNREEKSLVLHQILRAYANLDSEVGYTQGMNFLVGMLLYILDSEHEDIITGKQGQEIEKLESQKTILDIEEEAFWLFVYIMQKKDWRKLYINDTPKLQELLEVLDTKISEKLPKLHELISDHSCLIGCFSQHFLTILLYNSSFELAKRIFEVFLVAGEEILIHVLIKTLTVREKEILALTETECLFNFLRNDLMVSSPKCEETKSEETKSEEVKNEETETKTSLTSISE